MTSVTAQQAEKHFAATLARVDAGEPVVIRRGRREVAIVFPVPTEYPRLAHRLVADLEDEILVRQARRALREAHRKGFVSLEKVKVECGA
jgi:antitoxin (DNA-binding transcriptional repressor) of toxin-antitoxin stability system